MLYANIPCFLSWSQPIEISQELFMPCDDMTRRGLFVAAVRQEKQGVSNGRTSLTLWQLHFFFWKWHWWLMTKLYGTPCQARGRICLLANLQGGVECLLKGLHTSFIIFATLRARFLASRLWALLRFMPQQLWLGDICYSCDVSVAETTSCSLAGPLANESCAMVVWFSLPHSPWLCFLEGGLWMKLITSVRSWFLSPGITLW